VLERDAPANDSGTNHGCLGFNLAECIYQLVLESHPPHKIVNSLFTREDGDTLGVFERDAPAGAATRLIVCPTI